MASNHGSGPGKGGTGNSGKNKAPVKDDDFPPLGGQKEQNTTRDPRNPWGTAPAVKPATNSEPRKNPPDMSKLSLASPTEVSAPQPVFEAATTSEGQLSQTSSSTVPTRLPVKDDQQSVDGSRKEESPKEPSRVLKEND